MNTPLPSPSIEERLAEAVVKTLDTYEVDAARQSAELAARDKSLRAELAELKAIGAELATLAESLGVDASEVRELLN